MEKNKDKKIDIMERKNQFYSIPNFLDNEKAEEIYTKVISMPDNWFMKSILPAVNNERRYLTLNEDLIQSDEYKSYLKYNEEVYKSNKFAYRFSRTFDEHFDSCVCASCELNKYFRNEEMLKRFSKIINENVIELSETFLSKYIKDDFLSTHHDKGNGHYAFTYQLTKDWNPDHGGILHFVENNEIYKSVTPTFNTLTIFKIKDMPITDHFVSRIAVNDKARYAYTGWFIVETNDNNDNNKLSSHY